MFVVTAIDYRVMYRAAYATYAVGVGLLALVPLYGIKVNNARRWLGTVDYRIQPSELMKVLIVVALARYLHDIEGGPGRESPRVRELKALVVPFAMVLVPTALIIDQPDLGTGIMLLMVAFSVLIVSWRWAGATWPTTSEGASTCGSTPSCTPTTRATRPPRR
jgi:rod shape determining protein RodA